MAFRNISGAKLCVSSALRFQTNTIPRTWRESACATTRLHAELRRQKSTRTNLQDENVSGAEDSDVSLSSAAEATSVYSKWTKLSGRDQHPEMDLTFASGKEAYRSKKTSELVRALLVFNLCSVETLVNRQKEVRDLTKLAILHLQLAF